MCFWMSDGDFSAWVFWSCSVLSLFSHRRTETSSREFHRGSESCFRFLQQCGPLLSQTQDEFLVRPDPSASHPAKTLNCEETDRHKHESSGCLCHVQLSCWVLVVEFWEMKLVLLLQLKFPYIRLNISQTDMLRRQIHSKSIFYYRASSCSRALDQHSCWLWVSSTQIRYWLQGWTVPIG